MIKHLFYGVTLHRIDCYSTKYHYTFGPSGTETHLYVNLGAS